MAPDSSPLSAVLIVPLEGQHIRGLSIKALLSNLGSHTSHVSNHLNKPLDECAQEEGTSAYCLVQA